MRPIVLSLPFSKFGSRAANGQFRPRLHAYERFPLLDMNLVALGCRERMS